MRRAALLIPLLFCALLDAAAQQVAPQLTSLPGSLIWQNKTTNWSVDSAGDFTLASGAKTDWFVWPGEGDYHPDSAPRLLFKADENFSFSTRVDVTAHAIYDAGCLALYGTQERWAKLCLESQADGGLSIVSVITRVFSDDVTSSSVKGSTIYLKVAKQQRGLFFYASQDGRNWSIIRKFNLDSPDGLYVGFAVQSPEGKGTSAVFSDYRYSPGPVDLWKLQ